MSIFFRLLQYRNTLLTVRRHFSYLIRKGRLLTNHFTDAQCPRKPPEDHGIQRCEQLPAFRE